MHLAKSFRCLSLLAAALIVLPLLAACAPVAAPQPAAAPAAATAAPAATQPAGAATAPEPAGTVESLTPIVIPTQAAAQATAAAPAGTATSVEGQWQGPLKAGGQVIDMVIRFQGSGSDMKATLDIPTQGLKDSPLSKVSQQGSKVHWEAFSGARLATFDGELQADGSLAGEFQQAGFKGTLAMQRAVAQPTATVPYHQEELTFKNGAITLACTLSTPPSGGPFPAVELITGSGPQNRDEDLLGFQPFRLIADHLTRNGIAVLRCDDRGVGGSTGDVSQATSEDFAGDILAGVNVLKARPDINPKQIGLLGHSEGGLIAPMVAAKSKDVAFIILLSGPGLPGEQILLTQLKDIMQANNASQADTEAVVAKQKKVNDAIKTGQGWDELKAEWRTAAQAQVATLPAEQVKNMGGADKAVADIVQAQVDAVNNPWFKFFITYDPAPTLARVKVPVLALFGGKDTQVAAGPNEAAIKAALQSGGNTQLTTKVFADANHLYQQAQTGSPTEYASLPKEFVPGLLDFITTWIKSVVK